MSAINVPHHPQRKPDGILVWCLGFTCGLGATFLWLYAMFGEAA